ncbi:hypothetical protein O6H91_20G033200 [Diphasiastrum complanatum]|uniref:Uncharacterized protein n=1 Tax=Diphasiastrum complanatum TaxID=34168 RepID=A0ACC2AP94_DIPCM|nr:hypothetical protein O6H91_Y255400 [Diphasiastrum complanatum]KAJ7294468.1 hypothetical protein O6H91_Y255400 [Diphasiastrum complanatum]KAJ7519306.1 hypothetical protein O6H91_20G033200 [Diphasiastrum complanatum]
MFLSHYETTEVNQIHQFLLEHGESVQSLPGSKSHDTFTWAEPLKAIGSDVSAQLSDGPGINPNETQDELVALKCHYEAVQAERKDTLNKLLDLKENIRIFCRMRPFLPNDRWPLLGPILIPETATIHTLKCGQKRNFQLDKVFLPDSSQDEVFSEIGPLVRSAIEGQNVCIFAYGQTGSGKTFTMEGTKDHPGIVPRALQQVFLEASLDSVAVFSITFSMLEIYRGQLRDLLVKSSGKMPQSGVNCTLSIQMGASGSVEVENLTQVRIESPTEALHLYEKGASLRSTAWTNSNETSSRSHCLLRIMIEKNHGQRGLKTMNKLWLIDLGGSERLLKTKAQGQTLEEGKAINMSLSALGDVISALHRKKHHVPYRNSKLTQVLQDSLARSSKTLMLVHISPKEDDLGETICSLGFASRARSIHLGHELSSEAVQQREVGIAELVKSSKNLDEKIQNMRAEMKVLEQLIQSRKHFTTEDETLEEEEARHLIFDEEGSRKKSSKFLDTSEFKPKYVSSIPRFMNPTLSSSYKKRLSVDNLHSAGPDNKIRRRRHSFSCVADTGMKETEAVKSSRTQKVKTDDTRKGEGKQQYKQKLNTSSAILFEEVTLDSTVTRFSSRARILQKIDLNHSFWR